MVPHNDQKLLLAISVYLLPFYVVDWSSSTILFWWNKLWEHWHLENIGTKRKIIKVETQGLLLFDLCLASWAVPWDTSHLYDETIRPEKSMSTSYNNKQKCTSVTNRIVVASAYGAEPSVERGYKVVVMTLAKFSNNLDFDRRSNKSYRCCLHSQCRLQNLERIQQSNCLNVYRKSSCNTEQPHGQLAYVSRWM